MLITTLFFQVWISNGLLSCVFLLTYFTKDMSRWDQVYEMKINVWNWQDPTRQVRTWRKACREMDRRGRVLFTGVKLLYCDAYQEIIGWSNRGLKLFILHKHWFDFLLEQDRKHLLLRKLSYFVFRIDESNKIRDFLVAKKDLSDDEPSLRREGTKFY